MRSALLLTLFFTQLFSFDNLDEISQSSTWQNLIHYQHNKPNINDPSFLLSYQNFSPKNELIITLNNFLSNNEELSTQTLCKYPARAIFLKQKLNLSKDIINFEKCKDFKTYLKKTSKEKISLIFSSENLLNPSSMMGHTFFKISSKDKKKAHAISFYTIIDTNNPPKLIIKSTITGMKGVFSLTPYNQQLYKNLIQEERNIWEYELDLKEEEKQLIYYHFWELKEAKITYLFTSYNCATILKEILSLSGKKQLNKKRLWLTPKDLIKDINKAKLTQSVKLIPSQKWYVKMLLDEVSSKQKEKIHDLFHSNHLHTLSSFPFSKEKKKAILEKELITHYGDYLYERNAITKEKNQKIKSALKDNNPLLDLSQYKNPINTNDDSKILFGIGKINKQSFQRLKFIPTSHNLFDDNKEYFSESNLEIGSVDFLFHKSRVIVDEFTLYHVKSLIPYDPFTSGLSTELKINYERHFQKNMESYHSGNFSGGVGITKKYFNDLYLYGLGKIGLAYGRERAYFYLDPEIGLLLYQVFHMKSLLTYRYIYNQHGGRGAYNRVDFTHNIKLSKDTSFVFQGNKQWNKKNTIKTFIGSINYFF